VSEALQNIAKHAAASDARVTAVHEREKLTLEVTDNGSSEIESPPGGGTKLRAELPCE
jgi:nitrate/nitrite-specific signal transduction histidine kinase